MKVVLSGSGVKYPAHVGVLLCLDHYSSVYPELKPERIACVSGGAIVGAAYASGFRFEKSAGLNPMEYRGDLVNLILTYLPGSLVDYSWWPFSSPYGLIKGQKFYELFESLFTYQFKNLLTPLDIVTVDIEKGTHVIWNESNPEYIPKLVRASMAIPLVFRAVKLKNRLHVDGGVAINFPIDIYGTGAYTLGVRVRSPVTPNKVNNVKDFIVATIDAMMAATEREHIEDAIHAKIIYVDVDISSTNFDITNAQVCQMIKKGYDCAENWCIENGYKILEKPDYPFL